MRLDPNGRDYSFSFLRCQILCDTCDGILETKKHQIFRCTLVLSTQLAFDGVPSMISFLSVATLALRRARFRRDQQLRFAPAV